MRREVVVQKNPKSPVSEIFRTLRTNIQFMNSKNSLKSLLITSTLPGEGKSWVAANLAVTFAKAGKRVVLIDADMRKGRQHQIFNLENDFGLSNYLSGIDENTDNSIYKYLQRTEEPSLFLISRGAVPPNPSELLAPEMVVNMINELKQKFDLIIFDGTPSLILTDAVILSRFVDSTLIVTEFNMTKKENLAKIKRDIENVGGKIAGVVINKIPKQGRKYSSSYYYNYHYTYGEKEHNKEKQTKPRASKEYSELANVEPQENQQLQDNNFNNAAPEINASEEQQRLIKQKIEEYLRQNQK